MQRVLPVAGGLRTHGFGHIAVHWGAHTASPSPALGINGALYRTLRTTNLIENLNGSVASYCRKAKRWGDGQMVLRWVASALSDDAERMRKLRGCAQMHYLLKALQARRTATDNDTVRKAAKHVQPRSRHRSHGSTASGTSPRSSRLHLMT